MPRYGYRCYTCGTEFEMVLRVDEYTGEKPCPHCMAHAERVFDPPHIMPDIQPYYDKGMGAWVNTRQDRKAMMQERGLQPADESLTRKAEEILGEQYDKENRRPPKAH